MVSGEWTLDTGLETESEDCGQFASLGAMNRSDSHLSHETHEHTHGEIPIGTLITVNLQLISGSPAGHDAQHPVHIQISQRLLLLSLALYIKFSCMSANTILV